MIDEEMMKRHFPKALVFQEQVDTRPPDTDFGVMAVDRAGNHIAIARHVSDLEAIECAEECATNVERATFDEAMLGRDEPTKPTADHAGRLERAAHDAMRKARITYMAKTGFDCEAHYCEKPEIILRASRRAFPLLTDKAEEAEDYGRALGKLRAYCYKNNLY